MSPGEKIPGTLETHILISIMFGVEHASVTFGKGKVYFTVQRPGSVLIVVLDGQMRTGGTLSIIRISCT
jgi:hypothetical protein